MPSNRYQRVEDFIRTIIIPFYYIQRDIYVPVEERRWENDAEHSWSVAMLAATLAHHIDPSLDIGKVCQFALVHDVVEIYAKDTSVFANKAELASKADREAAALKQLAKDFVHFPWLTDTIEAYECKNTNEAKYVYAIDKYIAITFDYMEKGRLYRERNFSLAEHNKILEAHRQKAHSHAGVAKYYEEVRTMLNAHPEFFAKAYNKQHEKY